MQLAERHHAGGGQPFDGIGGLGRHPLFEPLYRALPLVLQRDLGEDEDPAAECNAADQGAVAFDNPFGLQLADPVQRGSCRQVDRFRERLDRGAAVTLQHFQQLEVSAVEIHALAA